MKALLSGVFSFLLVAFFGLEYGYGAPEFVKSATQVYSFPEFVVPLLLPYCILYIYLYKFHTLDSAFDRQFDNKQIAISYSRFYKRYKYNLPWFVFAFQSQISSLIRLL